VHVPPGRKGDFSGREKKCRIAAAFFDAPDSPCFPGLISHNNPSRPAESGAVGQSLANGFQFDDDFSRNLLLRAQAHFGPGGRYVKMAGHPSRLLNRPGYGERNDRIVPLSIRHRKRRPHLRSVAMISTGALKTLVHLTVFGGLRSIADHGHSRGWSRAEQTSDCKLGSFIEYSNTVNLQVQGPEVFSPRPDARLTRAFAWIQPRSQNTFPAPPKCRCAFVRRKRWPADTLVLLSSFY